MKHTVTFLCAFLLLGAGCAHIASTRSTFQHRDQMLELTVERHVDEIVHGPDSDEDQTLTLQLRDYKIGERLTVPSAKAAVAFEVNRFGPVSVGDEYRGYITVLEENGKKIKTHLDVSVTASTRDRSYTQKARFNGDFIFYRDTESGQLGGSDPETH